MIRFLLDRGDKNGALSELLIMDADLPATADSHLRTAELYLEAGDAQRALNDFSRALRLDRHNAAALSGAARAAFQLGDYGKARRYLENPDTHTRKTPSLEHLLKVVRTISSGDPLAAHLSMQTRQQRLREDIAQSLRRLDECFAHSAEGADVQALRTRAAAILPRLNSSKPLRDPEVLSSGLDLVYQIEEETINRCGGANSTDEALLFIAHRHGDLQ